MEAQPPAEPDSRDVRSASYHGTLGIWASSSGAKQRHGWPVRPTNTVMFLYSKKRIGQLPLNSRFQDSTASLRPHRWTLAARRCRPSVEGARLGKNPEEGSSATVADGVQGRVLEVRADCDGSRIVIAAIYQHVWSTAKTLQAVYFRP